MFGMEYIMALVKICIEVAFAIVTAIPLWISWNCIAHVYFIEWLPPVWFKLPYWHVVAFILVCKYVGEQVQRLTPKIVSVTQQVGGE